MEMRAEILYHLDAEGPQKLTWLLTKGNFAMVLLVPLLRDLIDRGLVIKRTGMYYITNAGGTALNRWSRVAADLGGGEVQ
jgi:predicted transcriptional regulator